jgi:signal transduction histidine kinase
VDGTATHGTGGEQSPGQCPALVVEDDGDGIPESDRATIFRAFTRLDTSRNRQTGGFGLGLAIVARIAALHRGRAIAGSSTRLGGARLALEWPGPSA